DTGKLRGSAGDGRPEHHVLLAGHPSQKNGPGALNDRVQSQTASTSLTRQARGQSLRQGHADGFGSGRRGIRGDDWRDTRWLIDTTQRLLPHREGGIAILRGEPGEIVPIRPAVW